MFTFPETVINFLGGSTSDPIMLTNTSLINNVWNYNRLSLHSSHPNERNDLLATEDDQPPSVQLGVYQSCSLISNNYLGRISFATFMPENKSFLRIKMMIRMLIIYYVMPFSLPQIISPAYKVKKKNPVIQGFAVFSNTFTILFFIFVKFLLFMTSEFVIVNANVFSKKVETLCFRA